MSVYCVIDKNFIFASVIFYAREIPSFNSQYRCIYHLKFHLFLK